MATQVKKLMVKHSNQRTQHAFGSWKPQFGSKQCATQEVAPPGVAIEPRDGGLHPQTHADDLAKREMVATYQRYVAVYDKVSTTRRRKSYYRRAPTVMMPVNGALMGRERGGSLVERMLRDTE